MKPVIDDLDRRILEYLQIDARMHSSEIARRLGTLSARAVRNRLDRLINEGYISITAMACPEALGYGIRADIAIDVEPGKIQSVAQRLVELEEVYYVAITTGASDISTSVVVKTMDELQDFMEQKVPAIPGVRNTVTNVITKMFKIGCSWPFPKELP